MVFCSSYDGGSGPLESGEQQFSTSIGNGRDVLKPQTVPMASAFCPPYASRFPSIPFIPVIHLLSGCSCDYARGKNFCRGGRGFLAEGGGGFAKRGSLGRAFVKVLCLLVVCLQHVTQGREMLGFGFWLIAVTQILVHHRCFKVFWFKMVEKGALWAIPKSPQSEKGLFAPPPPPTFIFAPAPLRCIVYWQPVACAHGGFEWWVVSGRFW